MKLYTLILIHFISLTCFSQPIRPLDKFHFDSTYRIVGLADLNHNNYNKYAFILDKPADMEALKKAIILEQKTDRVFELNSFIIYVVKSNEVIDQFIISPANNNMPINGEFYRFDFSTIRKLSRLHPLNFVTRENSFLTRREYEDYYKDAKLDRKFIFLFKPKFRYEGTFDLIVPKIDSLSTPKETIDSLTRSFHSQQIIEFNIVYILSQENIKNPNRMVLQVQSSNKVFDLYKPDPPIRKNNWTQNKLTVTSVWMR